jgi:hypothetical protein
MGGTSAAQVAGADQAIEGLVEVCVAFKVLRFTPWFHCGSRLAAQLRSVMHKQE